MSELSILVVEPDAVLLHNVAENILLPQGYFPLKTQTLAEGARVAQAGSPKLILLHADGEAALNFLREVTQTCGQSIPTILVVDQSEAQVDIRLLKLGVVDYVTWPLVPEELLHTIQQVVRMPSQQTPEYLDRQHMRFEFADMASHLMRNPLSVIQTSVNVLQSLHLSPEEEKRLLDKIWRQSQQLSTFIDELLSIFQVDLDGGLIQKVPISLPPLVEKVTTTLQHDEPDKQILVTMNSACLPIVAADPAKTEIILSNLLKGAARRCLQGGQISINVQPDTTEVVVSIKDNGDPIPVQPIDNIFQPYYPTGFSQLRVPSNYQLGLYTTKRLVELQQGRIWAKPLTEQAGSEFFFSLPIWERG